MAIAISIWALRIAALCIIFLSALPFLPVGAWWVRICDFPRVQLLGLLMLVLLITCILRCFSTWQTLDTAWLIIIGLTGLWQISFILPYTKVWSEEVPGITEIPAENPSFRIVVANLEIGNEEKSAVVEKLNELDPDILLTIETDQPWMDELKNLDPELKLHSHVVRDEGLGMALWTRLEVIEEEIKHLVSERRASFFTTFSIPAGKFNFVGLHPTPPGLKDSTDDERRDSRVRDAELMLIAKQVADKQQDSWIVTGDFNDVAWSHTTRLFKRTSGLKDPRIGRQMLNTYHAEYPLLRYPIDHVFVSKGFHLESLDRVIIPGSDHFAVIADLVFIAEAGIDPEPEGNDEEDSKEMIKEGIDDAQEKGVAAPEAGSTD
ncbi:endonuclease/exonuclease/phosphatase family protein [uncultured Rubinisphaera sp.]|uniref:endonuclease/exonuclease/phosphatase family protein n=1 Tax=uncultured Rubinisphaera sp. TaxID=1678686 RepID=UPI0030DB517A